MPFTLSGDWIPEKKSFPPIKIRKEKRKSSYVTVIEHLPLEGEALKELVSELKKHLATGGSIQERCIEIQGDKVLEIQQFLKTKGFLR